MAEALKPKRPPNAGKGRKRGTPNRLTTAAKEAFEFAFMDIGGPEALATWARKHRTMFYRLFARLIPLSVNVDHSDHILTYAEKRLREQQSHDAAESAPKETIQ
jgi:hypothetical protein